MTFLAPWALAAGAIAALALVALHLVARVRPASYAFPTARFVPDQRTLVSRAATRPRDLLLLALRVLAALLAAAAFAQPVLDGARVPVVRIVLADRSAAVADPAEVVTRTRALAERTPSLIVPFDTIAGDSVPLAELASARASGAADGLVSAALVRAQRLAASLERADSVELVLVSPVLRSQIDEATRTIRAGWPGRIHVERVAARAEPARGVALARRAPLEDVLGPALHRVRVEADAATAVRLVRAAPAAGDSAFARLGGTVVHWPAASSALAAGALVVGGDVVIADFGRRALPADARTVARWADGSAAAVERAVGAGCVREVGALPGSAGDLALRPVFQRAVRALLQPCGMLPLPAPAAAADIAMLTGAALPARVSRARWAEAAGTSRSPLVPWLLGAALLCAVAELAARRAPVQT